MFQINVSVDKRHSSWYDSISAVLEERVKSEQGVAAVKRSHGRISISIAAENVNKAAVLGAVKDTFIEMFLTHVKKEYLSKNLRLPLLGAELYNLLLFTLVVFDRESEREYMEKSFDVFDDLALDGYFYFRLGELRDRWDEIAGIAHANSGSLSDEQNLAGLLKFLMSAVRPKIKEVELIKNSGGYSVAGRYNGTDFIYRPPTEERLLEYLITTAPIKVSLRGDFSEGGLYKKLTSIFDLTTAGDTERIM